MLNTAAKLKESGFDAELLGLDDVVQDGNGNTALDLFLEDALTEAGLRLEDWTGDYYNQAHEVDADSGLVFRMAKAEFLLGSLILFGTTWSMATASEHMISVEGIQVQTYNLGLDKQKELQASLLLRAEKLAEPYLVNKASVTVLCESSVV